MDDTTCMVEALGSAAKFFADESCGQCSPCRIGTQILRQALERYRNEGRNPETLSYVADVAWGMKEASICGLGQAAALPLESAIQHFPQEFGLEP